MAFDCIVHNGTAVTVNAAFEVLGDAMIGIRDGRIVQLTPAWGDAPLPEAAEIVDARGGLIVPGLVNAHTHLPMTLFRGLADDLPLTRWLNDHIFPAESGLDARQVHNGALWACAEMLLAGTTTCCDGYFHEDAVAEAAASAGMRAVLGQGVIDFPAPGVPDPTQNIGAAAAYVDRWRDASPLLTPSIFCHSPYTCSAQTLRAAKAAARSRGLLFQIHVAETRQELEQIRSEHGTTPVRYLHDLELLDGATLLIHCIWIDADDIACIASSGAGVVHCAESNAKLAAGIAPVPEMLEAGIRLALGTDGCASNNNLDLFGEMDFASKLHKVHRRDPTVLDAAKVLRAATIDAAGAIGLADRIGSLEVGKQADLVIVACDRPHAVPLYNPVSYLVYTAGGADVRDVMVAGRWRVRRGRLVGMDTAHIRASIEEIRRQISAKPEEP